MGGFVEYIRFDKKGKFLVYYNFKKYGILFVFLVIYGVI